MLVKLQDTIFQQSTLNSSLENSQVKDVLGLTPVSLITNWILSKFVYFAVGTHIPNIIFFSSVRVMELDSDNIIWLVPPVPSIYIL